MSMLNILVPLALGFSTLGASSGVPTRSSVISSLRACDVVVSGDVIAVERSLEPATEALPMLMMQRADDFTQVTRVRMDVREVFWGEGVPRSIEFLVFASLSLYRDDYAVGQRMLVGLVWGDDVLAGNYWLHSERGRLLFSGIGWKVQDGSEVFADLITVREAFSAVAPSQTIESADLVVVGVLRDVRRTQEITPSGTDAAFMRMQFVDLVPIVGDLVASELNVVQITSGDYWPEWRDTTPFRTPETGRTYCMALRKVGADYAIINGINGIWEVRGDDLYFSGRSRSGLRIGAIREIRRGAQ
ncbi:MAG TPA: hypothetical protein VFX92_01190 [Candidatus Krumholzibacteria bacterium]|nr:hypothetical protein [Candidatus Krumholzibacteria bacterium]